MKIAVAATGKDEKSDVSEMAARAPYYIIFNEKGELQESIKNPFAIGGGGAGFGVAKMLADKGVDMVIAGAFGGNMTGAMEERGLEYNQATGNAKKAALEASGKGGD